MVDGGRVGSGRGRMCVCPLRVNADCMPNIRTGNAAYASRFPDSSEFIALNKNDADGGNASSPNFIAVPAIFSRTNGVYFPGRSELKGGEKFVLLLFTNARLSRGTRIRFSSATGDE